MTIHDQALALTLYRIAQEAVANALRHSQAQAVDIHLSKRGDKYRLEITDNGQGLSIESDLDGTSLGLRSMKNRAKLAKAHIEINNRPEGGLSIVITGVDQRQEQTAQKHLLP